MERAKDFLLFLCCMALGFFLYAENVHASVVLETHEPDLVIVPTNNSMITNVNQGWGDGEYINQTTWRDTWLVSAGLSWNTGALNGNYLSVNADYYLGVKLGYMQNAHLYSYMTSNRNTLRSGNLRCGIGTYKNGFDSNFLPEVSNFEVTMTNASTTGGNNYLFHIKFNYKQQITRVNINSSYMSCWFNQDPSNGLFALPGWSNQPLDVQYFYHVQQMQYSVSTDPNTALLEDISSQLNSNNQTIIDSSNREIEQNRIQQEENRKVIDRVNDTIKSDNVDDSTNTATSFFNNFENEDFGLSDIITMPLQLINQITSATCTNLEIPLPFVNQNVELPCMYNIYSTYFGSFLTLYQTITFGMISYWICINIFRMVKNFKNPDNDEIEVMEL